jgi:protein MAK11
MSAQILHVAMSCSWILPPAVLVAFPLKPHLLHFAHIFLGIFQNGVLYTGGEDRGITAWDLSSGKVSSRIEGAHATRVKGVVVFDNRNDGSELSNLIASASTDGVIRIWDVRTIGNGKPTPLAEANTKARLTCLAGTSLKCKY